jgi:hypothetical protein
MLTLFLFTVLINECLLCFQCSFFFLLALYEITFCVLEHL